MKVIIQYVRSKPYILYILGFLLLFPALLLNLGIHPFINDEAIRALVSMEMILSDDYVTPTIAGELYFKKPPVYNWIIAFFFRATGDTSELILRLVVIFSLLFFATLTFLFSRKHYGTRFGFLHALLFITSGRVLFYDSFHGLIDIAFSALVYLSFMCIYHFYELRRLWVLFITTYILTGITFLMKGFPSVYYQGVTLLIVFVSNREWKKLFSLQHLAGILSFLLLIGVYYAAYLNRNQGTFNELFGTLLSESTQKTAIGFGLLNLAKHISTFPAEFIYHFLPWTLLGIYFLKREAWEVIRKDKFLTFCLSAFFFNILIYWISPNTYARYLFVHIILLLTVLLSLHQHFESRNSLFFRIIDKVFFITIALMTVSPVIYPILDITRDVPKAILKTAVITTGILLLTGLYWQLKSERLLIIMLAMLVFRIGFNWFVFPSRERTSFLTICKNEAVKVGRELKNEKLYLLEGTPMEAHSLYYITRERNMIVEKTGNKSIEDAYYIIYEPEFSDRDFQKFYELRIKDQMKKLSVVKFE